ncbi:archaeosine tRNA-ribosyltransferase type 2 [Candidatus Methanomethylophilus alvi Mx1201]|uniref:Archaeosine tRNA-ribosyltransferase type 2 n=2 Tax=Methanomethylophilus alvi TaxID=1291540 RepID=M9SKE7_METAX|nr:DUF5591 domain-containing protein [Methanomethylophilus alvi]AGI85932.1 archaeosine tRNA-ribosyltransferase type 2 [Candidatus Methanomethylophilus alvi Mx1201]AYQ55324.1 queuine tRNA-ribosyltransferase containing PUA domain protein [Methanomethylophilus alvi]CDF31495.1 archaeosine tRNA-ribosyltransferase [Methanoculleus sp. CAG:1088]
MLDVVSRSQRGRVCEYRKGDGCIRTPFVLKTGAAGDTGITAGDDGRTVRILGSSVDVDPRLLTSAASGIPAQPRTRDGITVLRLPVSGDEIVPDDSEVVVVPNAFDVKGDFRRMVDQVMKARKAAGFGRVLVMLGIAEPANLALLSYMGVDVVDDSFCRAAGINGVSLIPEGNVASDEDCSEDNVSELDREAAKVARFIGAGRLRELVDQRSFSSADEVAALRIFDAEGYGYQEECCSTTGCRFSCNTVQALRRPDIARYQKVLSERYVVPSHKKVLLLLPCSAKKPYHTSKTHKLFASAIHTASHDTLVHEVIVTSPLGIVPRELDAMYPANSYDIPVTGEWKCEEKATIRRMLKELLEKGHYEKVVCHLGEDAELVEGLCDGMVETVVGDPVSPKSLENLDKALRDATKGMEPVDYLVDRREAIRSVLSFQFGKDVADAIMDENTYGIGKFPYWKVFREDPENRQKKTQLCMMSPERGMFSLTMDGAEIIAGMGRNIVEMQDFELKGSLFAVGVDKADHGLRIGDEAIVVCGGKVRGVGVAAMCGAEMEQMKRGIAVKMRHSG